jgi:hypothetical protein
MPLFIIFNTVNYDGIGDFYHLDDIMNALLRNERLKSVNFMIFIYFHEKGSNKNYYRIEHKLNDGLKKNERVQVYFGNMADHKRFMEYPELQAKINDAVKGFIISYDGIPSLVQFYAARWGRVMNLGIKNILPFVFIGEHENKQLPYGTFFFNCRSRSLGLYNDFHSCETVYGLKLKEYTPLRGNEVWNILNKTAPLFANQLLSTVNAVTIDEFIKNNLFIPVYLNTPANLMYFLTFLSKNLIDDTPKNIVIYLSGYTIESTEELLALMKEVRSGVHQPNFKIKDTLCVNASNQYHVSILECHGFTINILSGFYLDDEAYDAVYHLAKIAVVSGDNTLERCISMNILPFYWSTNHAGGKWKTISALRSITQDPALPLSEEARLNFDDFFISSDQWAHSGVPFYYLRPVNIKKMADEWPIVTDYLRKNNNFYHYLEDIIVEDIPPESLINQQQERYLMRNMKKNVKARLKSLAQQRWEEFNRVERENHYSVALALDELTAPFELSSSKYIDYNEMRGCLPESYSSYVRRLKRLSQGLPFSEAQLLKTLEPLTPQKHIVHFRDVVLLLRGIYIDYYPQFISELGIERLQGLLYEYSIQANPYASLHKKLSDGQMKALLLTLGDDIMLVCKHADEQVLMKLINSRLFNSEILIQAISYNEYNMKTFAYVLRHLKIMDALLFLNILGKKVSDIVERTPLSVFVEWVQTKALRRTAELALWDQPESVHLIHALRLKVKALIQENWLMVNKLNLHGIQMKTLNNHLLKKINSQSGSELLFTLRHILDYDNHGDILYTEVFIHKKASMAYAEFVVEHSGTFLTIYSLLLNYIDKREKEPVYTAYTSLFGFFQTGWGVSQQDKLAAANWFQAILTGECSFSSVAYERHQRALNQGRLGKIFNQCDVELLIHPMDKQMIHCSTQTLD